MQYTLKNPGYDFANAPVPFLLGVSGVERLSDKLAEHVVCWHAEDGLLPSMPRAGNLPLVRATELLCSSVAQPHLGQLLAVACTNVHAHCGMHEQAQPLLRKDDITSKWGVGRPPLCSEPLPLACSVPIRRTAWYLPYNPSNRDGQIPGCSFILSVADCVSMPTLRIILQAE